MPVYPHIAEVIDLIDASIKALETSDQKWKQRFIFVHTQPPRRRYDFKAILQTKTSIQSETMVKLTLTIKPRGTAPNPPTASNLPAAVDPETEFNVQVSQADYVSVAQDFQDR